MFETSFRRKKDANAAIKFVRNSNSPAFTIETANGGLKISEVPAGTAGAVTKGEVLQRLEAAKKVLPLFDKKVPAPTAPNNIQLAMELAATDGSTNVPAYKAELDNLTRRRPL